MCEVTRRNFNEVFYSLCKDVKLASFISIDCEFSGLFDDLNKCSLFDSPETRFNKLQVSLANFSIIQFGLSVFKYDSFRNTYDVSTYNFYLKPLPGLGAYYTMSFHPESVEFLCKNDFDFNKLFYEGINYVRLGHEQTVWSKVKDNMLFDRNNYIKDMEKYCSQVSHWLYNAKEDSEMFLEVNEDSTFICMLHIEIRKRFINTWTYFEGKVVKIRRITPLERSCVSGCTGENEILKTELYYSLIGFSRVLRFLYESQKPIVGHNILLDLIMIYKQFLNPTPVSYDIFKRAISFVFPVVFDTKHISFALREYLSKETTWNSNSLSDLYEYFKHGRGAKHVIGSPLINHTDKDFIEKTHFHDAGFDSYCTGYCFLKMAHMFCLKDPVDTVGKNLFLLTSLKPTNTWMMAAVASMRNRVNMSRGQVDYIVLDGKDPKSCRPGPLYIQSKTSFPLDISKVSEMVAKFGSVDIKPLTSYKALMAVSNRHQVEEILEYFKYDKKVKVTKYSYLKHTAPEKVLKAALVVSVVLTAVYLTRR